MMWGYNKMVRCWCCGERVDPRKCNRVYRKHVTQYYCREQCCQKMFIDDAGDPSIDWDEEDE